MIPTAVRAKIETRFGTTITYSKDCEALAKSIEKVCNERLSTTTLKRLFGFAKRIEHPRLYTFNVIANYIGYKDWSSLLATLEQIKKYDVSTVAKARQKGNSIDNIHLLHNQISITSSSQSIDIERVKSLCMQFGSEIEIFPFIIQMIRIAALQKNIPFLKQVFDLPVLFNKDQHSQLEFYYVGQTMGLMLRLYPEITDGLVEVFAANKNAQQYFIEWFVDEDYLQGYYGKLLDAYHAKRNTNIQDNLFYFALKYSQAIQADDLIQRISWYHKIKLLIITAGLHEIPVARYVGICLSEEQAHPFSSSSPYYKIIKEFGFSKEYEKAVTFMFYLCRELFRSQRTDWLVQIIREFEDHHGEPINKAKSHLAMKSENQLLIYIVFVYHFMGENKKAKQYFDTIDANLFDPFIYQQIHKDYICVSDKLNRL